MVYIGNVPLGGHYPIRVQSMTNTNTMDTAATVSQSIRMIEAGCEYVRITVPGMKDAENLVRIKKELRAAGFETPLIADVHFNPSVAEFAARIVEKVRINPGNYVDRIKSGNIYYNEGDYEKELERISKRINPLIKICKEYGTAIRVGVNHGSLSQRIMERFGDTPSGMAESALEFLRILEDQDFRNIVLSMKASNTRIMVAANRLLVHRMMNEGMNYPVHLGVTEAGSGEDGRIKSAVGIGALLEDGIGDTIRVSLTEAPEAEIPVAASLIGRYVNRNFDGSSAFEEISPIDPFKFHKHYSKEVFNTGENNAPVVIVSLNNKAEKINKADYVFTENVVLFNGFNIIKSTEWNSKDDKSFPLFNPENYFRSKKKSFVLNFILVKPDKLSDGFIEKVKKDNTAVLVFETDNPNGAGIIRSMFFRLINAHCKCPVIIKRKYNDLTDDEFRLFAATDAGLLFTDGLGDGLWLEADGISAGIIEQTAFNILQSLGARIFKTEFISCPTCGRTSYNIMDTLKRIKQYAGHLSGLKIAVMGCVVNGPGEMADADYGYVGCSPGKINLYKGKNLVRRNINEEDAPEALIKLIKDNGDWVEENSGMDK